MNLPVFWFESIDTTMDKARELIQKGMTSPAAIIAAYQTHGRGRIPGRIWEAAPGSSLLTTIALPVSYVSQEALSLKTGLALTCTLEELAFAHGWKDSPFLLKWPNDVMGSATPSNAGTFRKIAGILIEKSEQWFLIGIGINLSRKAYPKALHSSAVSLEEILGTVHIEDHGANLIQRIARKILDFSSDDDWRSAYRRRMWQLGKMIQFTEGHPEHGTLSRGILEGIDDSGRLHIRLLDNSLRPFASGEISSLKT